ncbi:MAG TPA: ComEC/Rec2 family competence protein [Acidimicrobiia bacterium]|nr:ComEC/Rec2 family competence protein [Acidimicrobiia bacterium]
MLPARTTLVIAAAAAIAATARRDRRVAAAAILMVIGGVAGTRAHGDVGTPLESGPVTLLGTAASDPSGPLDDPWFVFEPVRVLDGAEWAQASDMARLLVRGPIPNDLAAGEPALVVGSGRPAAFRVRAGSIGGVIEAHTVDRLGASSSVVFRIGNRLRTRVLGGLDRAATRPEGALLSGFLIGDVRRLPAPDVEALRLAGLSHFVAVSGSNVALFLLAWWLVTAPLGRGPRGRALLGLIGLAVFVVVTRWEPSVVRAAGMAGIVLVGRVAGFPVRPWTALGVAVAVLVVLDAGVVADVGFQLSVAATAGILASAAVGADRRPRWIWTTLRATLAAQAAVAPLLLHHFGTVPLLAPATNLVAAPVVALATSIGGLGAVTHLGLLVDAGLRLAGVVLAIARGAAGLPQLTTGGVLVLGLGALAALRLRPMRPVAAVAGVLVVLASLIPSGPPSVPTAVFLDVGQGDAALLLGPSGETVLIDGGPDPAVLREHLRDRSIRRIDLLVISHRHADHAGGLQGIASATRVGRVWHPPQLGEGSVLDAVVAELAASGALVESPAVGTRATVGAFSIEVLAPLRRYVSPNDGSLVLRVEAAGASIVFSGDIEAVAQRELGPLRADVLKVPHQGAVTSDLEWLRESAPLVAVISVGTNDFGHPSDLVIAALEAAGAIVHRTDRDGSVVVRLDRVAALPSAP